MVNTESSQGYDKLWDINVTYQRMQLRLGTGVLRSAHEQCSRAGGRFYEPIKTARKLESCGV
jgi:hypothetical protein